jgi:hypothetical protein
VMSFENESKQTKQKYLLMMSDLTHILFIKCFWCIVV